MVINNEYESSFGRRTDTLVIGNQNEELANIEFKKAATQDNVAIRQQGKNIRINGCILNEVSLMTDSKDSIIL
jgi:hypothetical protein